LRIKADFHCQSRYTVGADRETTLELITEWAKMKGIILLGTGDCLHPKWREELKSKLKHENEIYTYRGIYFVPSVELKIRTFVHCVILLPTLEDFDVLYKQLSKYGKLDETGVPNIDLSGPEVVDILEFSDFFLFPAHIFVPWQSLYAKYDSIESFFKDKSKDIYSVELGLSADPLLAEKVSELWCRSFLSNSDFHTVWAIGREFNLITVNDIDYKEIVRSIKDGNIVNYDLPPQLGKYYLTTCRRCKTHFKYEDARMTDFRCPVCGGKIYLGVKDRIEKELSKVKKECFQWKKKNFVHHIPLLQLLRDLLNLTKEKAKMTYLEVIKRANVDETTLLYNAELDRVPINLDVKEVIEKFRRKEYYISPGGGGKEGALHVKPAEPIFYSQKFREKSLLDFC
jgi:uncharacterized protein (TIGR00375 family)